MKLKSIISFHLLPLIIALFISLPLDWYVGNYARFLAIVGGSLGSVIFIIIDKTLMRPKTC